ncbi:hypothetical protein AR042_03855 [Listeria monocytogenes]|uniref:hypothetical protein n=1 Tax=Listeria monocytogenes TaxID=1639 RepID=UPI0010AF6A93|nr:hypothetical protein [Listeria monocytogenes]EAC5805526.1 hypothetical protein [Listeria monocytogenes]EAC9482211.1 hypothetical protein [Listeria monocytogenes]EHL5826520.1 hypothetical protein [Listeria monocytogenes]EKC6210737.1 hypothetical protein [Listeria monocytogenes]MDA5918475.1 hypothetical protein [Listeria monocytogenes]
MVKKIRLKPQPEKEKFLLFLSDKYKVSVNLIIKSWLAESFREKGDIDNKAVINFTNTELKQLNRLF